MWLAPNTHVQSPYDEGERTTVNPYSTYYVPGLRLAKAVKEALRALENIQEIHILIKGWTDDRASMPFRTSDYGVERPWSLRKPARRLRSLVKKWLAYVLVERWTDRSTSPHLTMQIDGPLKRSERRILERLWGHQYRCMKPVRWV